MTAVMIGVDPHQAWHTAVVISAAEEVLGEVQVRACAGQARRLRGWAAAWPERIWAIEGAGGIGHLLARQLLAAGDTNKNDPHDARPVAVAALRWPACRPVAADDHAAVPRVWPKRHRDLGRTQTQVACRLHAVPCELVPGGVAKRITAGQATQILAAITPQNAVRAARRELAAGFAEDLRSIDAAMRDTKTRLTAAVQAAGTSRTGAFGAGPVIAAATIAGARDISRFPSRDHFAACNRTAPVEMSSGPRKIYRLPRRGNRRLNHAIHMAAAARSATATAPAAPTTTRNGPKARPAQKPFAPPNATSATPSSPASTPAPGAPPPPQQ